VWAHLPFYTILLPAFLELCYSQTAYSSKVALNNAYRVSRLQGGVGGGLVTGVTWHSAWYSVLMYCS
jgi:hypothetical protein